MDTAPATIATQQTVTITATITGAPAETATAAVTLLPPITLTPTASTLWGGQTQQFTAVANGFDDLVDQPLQHRFHLDTGLYTAELCTSQLYAELEFCFLFSGSPEATTYAPK